MKRYSFNDQEKLALHNLLSERERSLYNHIQFLLAEGFAEDDSVVIDLENEYSILTALQYKLCK